MGILNTRTITQTNKGVKMGTLQLVKEVKTKSDSDFRSVTELNTLTSEVEKKYIKDILTQLKDTFTKLKIKYLIGEFSGGHDEGGFDTTYFADDKGEAITIPEEEKNSFRKWVDVEKIYTFENEKQKRTIFYSTTTNKSINVLEELEDILYKSGCLEEYGSFAGEFHVNGTVKLDVFTNKWQMDGNQSNEVYETVSDEGEL
jgi:hypothetical protein